MSTDLLAEDDASRRRALDRESFIVEAPAGAGKTELLTQRYLRLLAIADEPEEIVAITFTNKASGEMRSRIAESLERARGGVPPEVAHKRVTFDLARAALARSAARDWRIETQPGRLRLTTIDALCAGLARQMPLLSRFGAQPGTVEDASRHYREAARRALDHLEDGADDAESAEYAAAVAAALAWMDNDAERLIGLLVAMLARREQWRMISVLDDPESAIGAALEEMLAEELAAAAQTLDAAWLMQWMPLARFAAANLGPDSVPAAIWPSDSDSAGASLLANTAEREQARFCGSELLPEIADLPRWRALVGFLLTQDDTPRKTVNVKNGFPAGKEFKAQKDAMLTALAGLDEAAVAALKRLRGLPAPEHDNDDIVRALARLMKLAAAELWLVFREAGEVDFGELAARAIAALGDDMDPTELGLRLDWRIRHLLVDEFQDTSPTQVELLQRLTAGWQPGDGRTRFCVGDPMQSLYRFRKAEVGLFLRAKAQGLGGLRLEPLRLLRNNRACAPVVAWINAGFPQLFPAHDEPLRGEISYRPFVATRADLPDAGVTLHALITADDHAESAARLEAERVVALIEAEWVADPERRIAVLVRARSHLAALVAAIRRHPAGWRCTAVEIEALAERQAVQDLVSLTRALHHRGDRLHWLAILRAPWCGLTLADLHALAGDDHQATVWSLIEDPARMAKLSADGRRRLGHLREVMAEALAGQGRQSRRRMVEDAWKKLGGPHCLGAASHAADAQAFFKRLDELDAAGRFALDSLEDDMARLFAAPDARADGRLQLMTIHKAKGLEFDTVILPGLHRGTPPQEAPLLAWDSLPLESGERLLVAPVNRRRRRGAAEPTLYDFLQGLERERSANEAARVLYVAVTRAVRRLHLVAVANRKEDGALATPAANSLLARLWPAVEAEFAAAAVACPRSGSPGTQSEPAPNLESGEDAACFVPRLCRLSAPAIPEAWRAPPPAAAAVREEAVDSLAADVGTLVHALLEMAATDSASWPVGTVAARRPGFERWLAGRGWPEAEAREGAERAARMLATTLASADGQWVLRPRADAGAELALATVGAGGRALTRVVDRSFIEDGVRWIIDYKTADLGAETDAARLAAHAERYRAQLEAYAALFAPESLPLRLAVFYVAHGKLISLEYN